MKITYDIVTVEQISEEVADGPRVIATCKSKRVDFCFDCTEALGDLSEGRLQQLILDDWGGKIAYELAEEYRDTRTSLVFCEEQLNRNVYHNPDCDVYLHKRSAVKWLQHYRPQQLEEFLQDEDLATYIRPYMED